MAVWPTTQVPAAIDAAGFIPEVWSKKVLEAVHHRLVVLPVVNHIWEAELTYGDTMNVGVTNTVTATQITIGTEAGKLDPMTGAMVPIVVDQYWEAPVAIEYPGRKQSQVRVEALAQRESGYAIAKKIDDTLCALFQTLNSASALGTDGSAITDDVLIEAVETMDEADVPEDDRVWIFDPSSKADIMKIDKFVRSDYGYGDVIPTGGFRKDVYGAPVLITNNLTANSTGSDGVYMHRDAIAIIAQENNKVDRVEQPLKHQVVFNTTALWGVKVMRNTFGVPICTRLA